MIWPKSLQPYSKKPIAIFGAGVSGLAAKRLAEHLGSQVYLFDERKGNYFDAQAAQSVGIVILSPGFAPDHPWLELARAAQLPILPELDFASVFWQGRLVAITGTNGKSTLTELLCAALTEAGHPAVAVGNIGYALSDAVIQSAGQACTAVCEISSFQSEHLALLAPDAVLWTNFSEDHLERHQTMEAYFNAKWRLIDRLKPGGPCIVGGDVAHFAKRLSQTLPKNTHIVDYEDNSLPPGPRGTPFYYRPQSDNYAMARVYFEAAGLPLKSLEHAAKSLQGAPHRLQCVGIVHGVTFWNDSKGTNFASVLAALANFNPQKVLWLGGGKMKGGDIPAFARAVAKHIREAVVIGEAASILSSTFASTGTPCAIARNLQEAFVRLAKRAKPGDTVLLSPGFASLDQFKNYADRGEQFESCVFELSKAQDSVSLTSIESH